MPKQLSSDMRFSQNLESTALWDKTFAIHIHQPHLLGRSPTSSWDFTLKPWQSWTSLRKSRSSNLRLVASTTPNASDLPWQSKRSKGKRSSMLHSPAEKKRKRVGERMRENKKRRHSISRPFHLKNAHCTTDGSPANSRLRGSPVARNGTR